MGTEVCRATHRADSLIVGGAKQVTVPQKPDAITAPGPWGRKASLPELGLTGSGFSTSTPLTFGAGSRRGALLGTAGYLAASPVSIHLIPVALPHQL